MADENTSSVDFTGKLADIRDDLIEAVRLEGGEHIRGALEAVRDKVDAALQALGGDDAHTHESDTEDDQAADDTAGADESGSEQTPAE